MKPFQSQTFYELLEIDASASVNEIRDAFQRASVLYAEDSVAMYALEDPTAAEALRDRLSEALAILSDPDRRDEYDRGLGLPPRPRVVPEPTIAAAVTGEPQPKQEAEPEPKQEAEPEHEPEPQQLAMTEMLKASAQVVHSTNPTYSVSYIPRTAAARSETLHAEPTRASEAGAPRKDEPAAVDPMPARAPDPASLVDTQPNVIPPALVDTQPVRTAAARPGRIPTPQRDLEVAAELAQQSAIAAAEAAMAQVSARARENRPRQVDIPADAVFSGELLRQVREARGMAIQQLADRTRISRSHLENVEADRYGMLPAPVYLRGILVSIARELGLDPVRVSKSYLSLAAGKTKEG